VAEREDRRYNRCVAGSIAEEGRKNCLTGMMVLVHSFVAPTEDTLAHIQFLGPEDNQHRGLEEVLAAGMKVYQARGLSKSRYLRTL
jgi:hypothetical protein